MYRMSFALAALALLATQPVAAKPLAPGCNPAIQNWQNGSKDTCPPMGGSAVGTQAPTFIEPPVEEYCHPKTYKSYKTYSRKSKSYQPDA
jgi:hypothetical protein